MNAKQAIKIISSIYKLNITVADRKELINLTLIIYNRRIKNG